MTSAVHAHSKCLPHHHPKPRFPGTITGAGWRMGGGVVLPSKPNYQGFYVEARMDPATKTKAIATLDAAKRTVTIMVKTKAGAGSHKPPVSRMIKVPTPKGLHLGTLYKLIVMDTHGDVLRHTTARPAPGK